MDAFCYVHTFDVILCLDFIQSLAARVFLPVSAMTWRKLILSLTGGAGCLLELPMEFTKHFSRGTMVRADPMVNLPSGVYGGILTDMGPKFAKMG